MAPIRLLGLEADTTSLAKLLSHLVVVNLTITSTNETESGGSTGVLTFNIPADGASSTTAGGGGSGGSEFPWPLFIIDIMMLVFLYAIVSKLGNDFGAIWKKLTELEAKLEKKDTSSEIDVEGGTRIDESGSDRASTDIDGSKPADGEEEKNALLEKSDSGSRDSGKDDRSSSDSSSSDFTMVTGRQYANRFI